METERTMWRRRKRQMEEKVPDVDRTETYEDRYRDNDRNRSVDKDKPIKNREGLWGRMVHRKYYPTYVFQHPSL